MSELPGSRELVLLDKARRALTQARSLDEVKSVRDKAEAVRSYVKAAKLGLELHNRAAEIKLRAERKAGEMLASLGLRGGDRRSKSRPSTLKLDEIGITKDDSSQWQQKAEVPEKDFEQFLEYASSHGREVTTAGLLRLVKKRRASTSHRQTTAASDRSLRWDASDGNSDNRGLSEIRELFGHLELLESLMEIVVKNSADQLKPIERRTINRLFADMKQLAASIEHELERGR